MPDGARRLRAAVALHSLRQPQRKNWISAYARWAAAACVFFGLGGALWWASQRPAAAPVAVVLHQPGPPIGTLRTATLDIPAVITRGANAPPVSLPADALLRLRIELREAAKRQLSVSIRSAGSTVWSGNAGPAANGIAEVWIPPGVLSPGDYEAVIDGAGLPQICVFRVVAAP
jgi:hypothetical protein